MGRLRTPVHVKLFCALLYAPTVSLADIEAVLQETFGPVTSRSPALPFTQTTYYQREMGPALTRCYIAFSPLHSMSALAAVKHTTNDLETRWTVEGNRRRVNLDPGYLTLAKVVLATTKDYSHRLYIGAGIYAEVTLRYQHKNFQPWAWTYPDYQQPATLQFFNQLREEYKAQLRA